MRVAPPYRLRARRFEGQARRAGHRACAGGWGDTHRGPDGRSAVAGAMDWKRSLRGRLAARGDRECPGVRAAGREGCSR